MSEQEFWKYVDELAPHEFLTAYAVLEKARDDDRLTPDQQDVLNEAHAIVQEFEAMEAVENMDPDDPMRGRISAVLRQAADAVDDSESIIHGVSIDRVKDHELVETEEGRAWQIADEENVRILIAYSAPNEDGGKLEPTDG